MTNEPITLAEVKAHLRLDSGTFADDVTTYQSLVPASRAANTYNGVSVDVLGKTAMVNLNAGTNQAGGTLNVHIEESDDNAIWTDWTGGTFTAVTTANDNAVFEKQYTGSKQYIRVVAVVAVAACEFGVDVLVNAGSSSEDTLLSMWISTAREYGEDYTGHAFAPQTIDLYLNDWPPVKDFIEWPNGPLTSVTSLKYKDEDGTETTMTNNVDYVVDSNTFPGKVFLPDDAYWPTTELYPHNAITLRAVCGYTGAVGYTLPMQYKQAMLMHIGFMYKWRDAEIPIECMKTVNALYNVRRSWCV